MRKKIVWILCMMFLLAGCQEEEIEISQTETMVESKGEETRPEDFESQEEAESYVYTFSPGFMSIDLFLDQAEVFKEERDYLYVYSINQYSNEAVNVLNEILEEKIGKKVRIIVMPSSYYRERNINTVLEGLQEREIPVDVISFSENALVKAAEKGYLVSWDEYLISEKSAELRESIPDIFWERTEINGHNYGPGNMDPPSSAGWMVNAELMEKYNFTEEDLAKDITELEPILEIVAEREGISTIPMAFLPATYYEHMPFTMIQHGLPIGFWVDSKEENCTVVNLFDTDRMKENAECIQEYFVKGYLKPYQGQSSVFMMPDMGEYINYQDTVKNPFNPDDTNEYIQVEYYKKTDLSCANVVINTVPAVSDNVEAAMAFLNFIHINQEAADLLRYGVEGVDYVREENLVVTKEEPDSGHYPDLANRWISSPSEPFETVNKKLAAEELFESLERSPLVGFSFDPVPVREQVNAVQEIFLNSYYSEGFMYNYSVLAEERYEEMQKALKDAGIDAVVAEMNRQIQEYLAQ